MDIQSIVAGIGASGALQDAAAKHGISPDQAQSAVQAVLEQIQGGGSIEGIAENVAAKAGISPSIAQAILPTVTGLLQGHAANAEAGVQGVLGGVINSLQSIPGIGGMISGLDANHDGSIADEALGMLDSNHNGSVLDEAAGLLGGFMKK